mmetsp:Transcript_16950/g.35007  ORF Transcript_16950/g.35007 Transcript_16950/m.35007 type:complete len:91 (+) Transcript_16950:903-1175(+)
MMTPYCSAGPQCSCFFLHSKKKWKNRITPKSIRRPLLQARKGISLFVFVFVESSNVTQEGRPKGLLRIASNYERLGNQTTYRNPGGDFIE